MGLGGRPSGPIVKVTSITGRIRAMKYRRAAGRTVQQTLLVLEGQKAP